MSSPDPRDPNVLDILTSALLSQSSPHTVRPGSVASLRERGVRCCCEQDCCQNFLESKALLEGLEKDVKTAASLGQALLERHERSMQDAASERNRLHNTIQGLETRTKNLEVENEDLEKENTRTIDENRKLLARLEEINQGMSINDIRVREMQEDLDAVNDELTRVTVAAARANILEAQLAALETEHVEMKKNLIRTKEDERAAVARWRQAERKVSELTVEVERIEREHRMERARAQNLLDRLERRQGAERRNGAFSSALAERTAMSQFMRDILAENNHLQSGLAELRDMLLTSQEEVGALREQLLQFARYENGSDVPLSNELPDPRIPVGLPAIAPELHFHHHVHKEKPAPRRVKRRGRGALATDPRRGIELSGPSDPTSPKFVTRSPRWSAHSRSSSGLGMPSMGSSPVSTSTFRDSSIFERSFEDSTRPSTADTEWDSMSTNKYSRQRRSARDSLGVPPFSILYTEEIPENSGEEDCDELDADEEQETQACEAGGEVCPAVNSRASSPGGRSVLRKAASHESLLTPAPELYPATAHSASFAPTSPAAIAAAAASKAEAISARNGGTLGNDGSAAYRHLHLLAGGSIRGKGLQRSNTAKKQGWFGGWGWSAPSGLRNSVTEEQSESEASTTSVRSRSRPVDIAGLKTKSAVAAPIVLVEGEVSTGTSPAKTIGSVKSARSVISTGLGSSGTSSTGAGGVVRSGNPAQSRPVPLAVYRSRVDEQLLQESLMEHMQMMGHLV